jgi:hypothetical protein
MIVKSLIPYKLFAKRFNRSFITHNGQGAVETYPGTVEASGTPIPFYGMPSFLCLMSALFTGHDTGTAVLTGS